VRRKPERELPQRRKIPAMKWQGADRAAIRHVWPGTLRDGGPAAGPADNERGGGKC
jgi:hypothetical protein